jgi:hypothetical protein
VPAGPRLARRTTLALAAGLVGVAGCDDGSGSSDGDTPASIPAPDPDVALVDGVLEELGRALRLAAAAGASDLVALHRAHIEALDATAPTPGRRRQVDPAALQRRERRLQTHLVEAAVAAGSGALAGLLASMSAAVSQRESQRVSQRVSQQVSRP